MVPISLQNDCAEKHWMNVMSAQWFMLDERNSTTINAYGGQNGKFAQLSPSKRQK